MIRGSSSTNTYLTFGTDNAERLRIDSSGNLLVGTTTYNGPGNASSGDYGVVLREEGILTAGANASESLVLNRMNSDGDLATFKRSGSTVGSIGVDSGDNLYIGSTAANHGGIYMNDNGVLPMSAGAVSDNTRDLGNPSFRWNDLFLKQLGPVTVVLA